VLASACSGSAPESGSAGQVANTIAGVSDFASRTRQNAQQILQAARDLNREAGALQLEAQEFIARVRAA
jgi:methyl-accepting chemotaxis protein